MPAKVCIPVSNDSQVGSDGLQRTFGDYSQWIFGVEDTIQGPGLVWNFAGLWLNSEASIPSPRCDHRRYRNRGGEMSEHVANDDKKLKGMVATTRRCLRALASIDQRAAAPQPAHLKQMIEERHGPVVGLSEDERKPGSTKLRLTRNSSTSPPGASHR